MLRHGKTAASTQLANNCEASSAPPNVNIDDMLNIPRAASELGSGRESSQFHQNGSHSLIEARNCVVPTSMGESVVKAYFCKICDKSFSNSKDCRRHTIVHSTFKPYQCPYCDHTANLKFNLKKHVERMHLSQLQVFEHSMDMNVS